VLHIAPAGAPILLYEDGTYAVAQGTQVAALVQTAMARHPIYALEADLEARGIRRVLEGVQVINYDGFVQLVEQHDVAPWL
jgi:tRNA 2-thiouridine synthesizing protein B